MMRSKQLIASLLCITASCVGVAPDEVDGEGSASAEDGTGSGNDDQSPGDTTGGRAGSGPGGKAGGGSS